MEGEHCPLSQYGYNRDGKKGKLQIVIGLLTDSEGCPLAVEVFEGNTNDQSTVMARIDSMRKQFGIDENPEKEEKDRAVRQRLLERTEEKLEMIRRNVRAGRWKSEKVIAKRLYTWLNNWQRLSYLIVWEARRRLDAFISHDTVTPEEQNNPEEAYHSLRTIWETLDREMLIGTIKVGDHISERLSTMSTKAGQILEALKTKPTPKRLEKLRLAG